MKIPVEHLEDHPVLKCLGIHSHAFHCYCNCRCSLFRRVRLQVHIIWQNNLGFCVYWQSSFKIRPFLLHFTWLLQWKNCQLLFPFVFNCVLFLWTMNCSLGYADFRQFPIWWICLFGQSEPPAASSWFGSAVQHRGEVHWVWKIERGHAHFHSIEWWNWVFLIPSHHVIIINDAVSSSCQRVVAQLKTRVSKQQQAQTKSLS